MSLEPAIDIAVIFALVSMLIGYFVWLNRSTKDPDD